jgi:hypothetical protein
MSNSAADAASSRNPAALILIVAPSRGFGGPAGAGGGVGAGVDAGDEGAGPWVDPEQAATKASVTKLAVILVCAIATLSSLPILYSFRRGLPNA